MLSFCSYCVCLWLCVCFTESEVWQWHTNLPQMSLLPVPPTAAHRPITKPRCLSASLVTAASSCPAPWQLQHHLFVRVALNSMHVKTHSVSFQCDLLSLQLLSYDLAQKSCKVIQLFQVSTSVDVNILFGLNRHEAPCWFSRTKTSSCSRRNSSLLIQMQKLTWNY